VGLNLFIASYRFERSIVEVYLSTLPYFFLLLASVIVIAFWPWLSLVFV
jgi:C4-dicarboxylate transporter DctM subunit